MPIVEKWKLGCKLPVGDMPGLSCFPSILLGWRTLTRDGPESGSRAHFSTVRWLAAHVKRCCVLGIRSSSNFRQRLKSTLFSGARSHLRWQGELHNSRTCLKILLYIPTKLLSFPTPSGLPSLLLLPLENRVHVLPSSTPHSCPTCVCKDVLIN